MTTDNPKVSGYVSQEICDRLKTFKEERKLKSISEALGIVLTEYFKVEQKVVYQTSLLSGDNFVSIDRFEALEKKFSELSSSLPSELERMFSSLRGELLSSLPKSIEAETINVESEPLSESTDEPLSELPSESIDELPSELVGEPEEDTNNLQLGIIDIPIEELLAADLDSHLDNHLASSVLPENSNPISGKLLAKRLTISGVSLSTKKSQLPEAGFYRWLKTNDPDKISWQPVGGDLKIRVSGWIPAENTPSELLSRLKEWLLANPE